MYVIRLPNAVPGGQCWYDGSVGDGRTLRIQTAAEFMDKKSAENKLSELRSEYPDTLFVIDPAPEGLRGMKIGKGYVIV